MILETLFIVRVELRSFLRESYDHSKAGFKFLNVIFKGKVSKLFNYLCVKIQKCAETVENCNVSCKHRMEFSEFTITLWQVIVMSQIKC